MKGHDAIIALRKTHLCPSFVFVNDYPCKTDWFEHGDHATVCTAGDVIQTLDMRFLVGCKVSITSPSEIRAKALFAHAKAAGAIIVAAGHAMPRIGRGDSTGWCEIYHKEAA